MGQRARNTGSHRSLKKQECLLAENPQQGHSPANTLIFSLLDPFQTSDLQNYEIMNLCCFRSPCL